MRGLWTARETQGVAGQQQGHEQLVRKQQRRHGISWAAMGTWTDFWAAVETWKAAGILSLALVQAVGLQEVVRQMPVKVAGFPAQNASQVPKTQKPQA